MDEASGITAGSAENPLIRLESKFVSGQRLEQILRDWDNIQSAESIHHDQRRSLKLGSFRAKMRGSQVKAMLSDPIFARFAAAFVILKEVRFDSLIAFLNCGSKEEENMILRNIQKESHWRPKFERLFGLKRQNLNFACGIHLAADETPENILEYCKSNSEAIYQCAQMDPDFLSSLKSKIQHIAKFSQTIEARARILLEIVKQRANIDAAVLEKYSNACHEMNHFKLEFLRKELVKWRIIDSRSIEDMPFANLIDNVLCFLVYENDFPGSFTPPLCPISPEKSYSAIEEEKDDISSLNEEVLSNEEVAKAEMQTEPRESSPSYAYSPNVDIYGWMMSLIMSIAFFSLIYVSFISITNSVLQKNDNICRLSNTGLINSLNDFNFRTSALHRVLYNEVRNNYLKLDNSLESDRILAKVFLLSNASAIFLADSSGKFLGISKSEDGLVIRSIDHSQSSCLFEFSSRSIDLSLERDLSTPPRNLTCAFDPRSEVWYTAEAEYRPQWSKRYLISSGNHVNYALRGSFLKDSTTNTAIIMEYCVETLRSLVLDFENPHPSSSCILDPESLNLIVSSSELDSKTFSQLNVIPSESNDSNIRETFDQFVKFSDFNPYASSSSYSFSLKHISACSGVYQSENGLSLTVVNSFSLDLFFRNRNLATIGSSLAAVFAILLSIGMIFLSRTIRGLQQETLRKISSSINAVRASLRVTQASVYEFVSSLQNFAIRRKTSPNVVVQNDDGAEMTELSHSESNFSTNIKASEAHHSKPTTENSNYFTLPRLINYFYISLFLIFLLTFIVWYVWSTLASSNERPKSIAIVEENSHQIFLSLRRFVKNSEIAIQMMLARVSFGRLTFSPLDSLSSRDTFVMGLLDEFSLSGNYSQFSAAYFSQPNREFAGAAIYHDVEGINFISLAQDSSTGLCYSEFLTFDNFTRDSSSLEYEDCSYNALSLPWYQGAINSANMHWSDIYLVRGRESRLGVSLSSAIRSIEGSVKAVIGIDISLDKISDLLSHSEAKHFNDTSIIALLIEPDGTIVSNSLQVSYKDNRGKNETINAAEFNETSVADTWSFLTYGNQGITDVYSKLTAIERVFQDPLTYLVDISGNVSVLNWKLIVLGSWYVFLKSLYNNDEFSLMICFLIFAVSVISLLVSKSFFTIIILVSDVFIWIADFGVA